MGTRSKKGWNERCTRRGPLSGSELDRHLNVCENPRQHTRAERRTAHARLRHQCRYLRKHVKPEDRTSVQENVIALGALL